MCKWQLKATQGDGGISMYRSLYKYNTNNHLSSTVYVQYHQSSILPPFLSLYTHTQMQTLLISKIRGQSIAEEGESQ
jgi:hypothetical protein